MAPDPQTLEDKLKDVVFCLEWRNFSGHACYGTGFFVTAGGLALTAFHNLSEDVLAEPDTRIGADHRGSKINLVWALPEAADREWQEKYDVAVLQAEAAPENLRLAQCVYLPSEMPDRERGQAWAGRKVVALGYPGNQSFAVTPMHAMVSYRSSIRDTMTVRDGKRAPAVPQVLDLVADVDGPLNGLRGMSGAPVCDIELGGIVGLLVGVDNRVYVTELVQLVRHWELARRFLVKREPPPHGRVSIRLPWVLLAVTGLLLLTAWGVWRMSPGPQGPVPVPLLSTAPKQPGRLAVSILRFRDGLEGSRLFLQEPADWAREPLRDNASFTEGERVRFAITSAVSGYLYVVDQELTAGGQARQPYLIFPTRRTLQGRNRVEAGTEFLFPGTADRPPYLQPRSLGGEPDYAGELITTLVFREPLALKLGDAPLALDPKLASFMDGRARLFDHPATEPALAVERIRALVTKR